MIQQTSTQVRPEFTQQNELRHSISQFKVILGTGIVSHQRPSCFDVGSNAMVEKLPTSSSTTSTSTLVNVRLRKMILKKISLS